MSAAIVTILFWKLHFFYIKFIIMFICQNITFDQVCINMTCHKIPGGQCANVCTYRAKITYICVKSSWTQQEISLHATL